MYQVKASNANEALRRLTEHILMEGTEDDSRAGKVLVAPGPIMLEITNPRQRVIYSPTRDGNCIFHAMEFLWFMTGGNEIEFPVFFNSSYGQFSDDSMTMWDSYGARWKTFFGYDQLELVIEELKSNPKSRRCNIAMWNAWPHAGDYDQNRHSNRDNPDLHDHDLHVATHGGKAVPCNTNMFVAIRDGKLNLTVINRSNDLHFGLCGANVVHMSFLLEYLAMRIGVPIGSYFTFSNNCHFYLSRFSRERAEQIAFESENAEYEEPGPAITEGFDEDLRLFMPWALTVIRSEPWGGPVAHYSHPVLAVPPCRTPFFHAVAIPMFLTWVYRKWKDEYSMNICLEGIDAPDWQRAVREWIDRRKK